MKTESFDYAAYVTLDIIGGKWSLMILCHLSKGTVRFCEFPKRISGLTQKMLTKHLRQLEEHGLVQRVVYPEVPPKVEYTLTKHGESLIPVLNLMEQWGKEHLSEKGHRSDRMNEHEDNLTTDL